MDIKMVFFDVGGVIIDFKIDVFYQYLANASNFKKEETKSMLESNFLYQDLWDRVERGKADIDILHECARLILGLEKESFPFEVFKKEFVNEDLFKLKKCTMNIARQLKNKGYRLGIISNVCQLHWQKSHEMFGDLFSIFDTEVNSYDIGVRKPKEEMWYRALIKAHCVESIDRWQCLLIDDLPKNIESIKKYGMNGIVFKSCRDLRDQLKKLEIL